MKTWSLLLIIFWGGDAHTCIVEGYSRYIKTEKLDEISVNDVIKYSNCQDDVKSQMVEVWSSSSGKLHRNHLKKILKNSEGIDIRPEVIDFFDLEEALKSKYPLKTNWVFKNTSFSGSRQLYHYGDDDRLNIVCHDCDKPGKKVLEIRFHNPLNGKKKVVWGETYIAVNTPSLIALRTLGVGSQLRPSYFERKLSYSISDNESFFVNDEELPFYKTNKVIRQGAILKDSDMSAINLIGAGKPVKTIIKKGSMKLTGVGIPMRSGKFGESVRIKGMDGKRVLVGKVVGVNQVVVEL